MDQNIMRQAQGKNIIYPIYFFDEQWIKVRVPNTKDMYWISTKGRVYNEISGYILQGHVASTGYVIVRLMQEDGSRKDFRVHRLEMLMFCPPEDLSLVVNHKDGVKTNNDISNLEWVTTKENVAHAFANNLRCKGEKSSHSIFTNDQVNKVCRCMENGMNLEQISLSVFGVMPTTQISTLCKNIYSKKFWVDISSNYDVGNYDKGEVFTLNQIHKICKLFESNIDIDTISVLKYLSISTDISKEEYLMYYRAIRNIRLKKSHIKVSSQYNF